MSSENLNPEDNEKGVQELWKVPAVAQFVSLFRFAFKLQEIEIEELEDGLTDKSEVGSLALKELLVALVRGIHSSRGVKADTLDIHLRKVVKKIWSLEQKQEVSPLNENTTFSSLELSLKVDVLYSLCLYRIDQLDAVDAMKKMDAAALRVQPLGSDDLGNEYWYFYGTRLYKQEPAKEQKPKKDWQQEWNEQKNQSFTKRGPGRPRKLPRKPRKSAGESDDFEDGNKSRYMNIDEKSRWSVVCNTIEDWVEFAEKFKDSKSDKEKKLFRTVADNFLPVLNDIYLEKEQKLQQKLRELIPKRVVTRTEAVVTRRESRKRNAKSLNGCDDENSAYKEHVARDRANRLEERNRRLHTSADEGPRKRSRRMRYVDDDDEEDDYEEDDDMIEEFMAPTPAVEVDYRREYVPVIRSSSDMKSQVMQVLSEVKLQKDSWPFLYPVDEGDAPGYYEIITEPMDLSTITRRLMQGCYKTVSDVDADFERMVSNCKYYNGEQSEMSHMAKNLWRVFRKGISKIVASTVGKDDSTASESKVAQAVDSPKPAKEKLAEASPKQIPEKGKKKKKGRTKEALEILSKEAELAVERSQSMDEDTFRKMSHKTEQFGGFSDLKIVPIHSHPSSLIEKFMSDSSSQGGEDSSSSSSNNSPSFSNESADGPTFGDRNDRNADGSTFGNQNVDHPTFGRTVTSQKKTVMRTDVPTIHYLDSNEENSVFPELMSKIKSKSFNILSDGEGTDLNMLSDNEVDLHCASSCNLHYNSVDCRPRNVEASSDNGNLEHNSPTTFEKDSATNNIPNLMRESSSPNPPSSRGSVNSYCSHSSISPSSSGICRSPKDSALSFPKHNERNDSFIQSGINVHGFDSFSSDDFSTVDASSLGLASTNVSFRKQQYENGPISTDAENVGPCSYDRNHDDRQSSLLHQEYNHPTKSDQGFLKTQLKEFSTYPAQHLAEEEFQTLGMHQNQQQYSTTFQSVQNSSFNQESSNSQSGYFSSHQLRQDQAANLDAVGSRHFTTASSPGSTECPETAKNQLKSSSFIAHQKMVHDSMHQQSVSAAQTSFQDTQNQASSKDQKRNPNFASHHKMQNKPPSSEHTRGQSRHSPNFSLTQTIRQDSDEERYSLPPSHEEQAKSQSQHFSISSRQELQNPACVEGHPGNSTFTSHQVIQGSESSKTQARYSPTTASLHQKVEGQESAKSQQRHSPTISSNQEWQNKLADLDSGRIQQRYSPSMPYYQELQNQLANQESAKSQSGHSPTISSNQEFRNQITNQQSNNQLRYLPTFGLNAEFQNRLLNQEPAKNHSRYSPTNSSNQEWQNQLPNQETNKNQRRCSPTIYSSEELKNQLHNQEPAESLLVNSSVISSNQEFQNQITNQQSAKNQPRYLPVYSSNTEFQSKPPNQEPTQNQPRYSPTLPSNQEVLNKELPLNSAEHSHPEMQNEVLNLPLSIPDHSHMESSSEQYQARHKLSTLTSSSHNATTVAQPSFLNNSGGQTPSQVIVPYAKAFPDQCQMVAKPINKKFPAVSVSLPPSSGEILVVPGGPESSKMTFHLYAKPNSDPTQTIQSSLELQANNSIDNQVFQKVPSVTKAQSEKNETKNPAKQDEPTKRRSPIQDLQLLAMAPTGAVPATTLPSRTSSSDKSASGSRRPTEISPKLSTLPATSASDAPYIIRPNVMPAKSSNLNILNTTSIGQPRSANLFQPDAPTYHNLVPNSVPLVFPNFMNRLPSNCGSFTATTCSPTIRQNVGAQRFIFANGSHSNSVLQNAGNGQYILMPSSKEIRDQNAKVKVSERSPPESVMPSPLVSSANVMQSFSFQNAQMNPSQIFTQVPMSPYGSPYYIIADPNTFQNTARYPVMQPISFQNR